MGCINSRTDINDLHPNTFQVMNVDDLGNLITPGRLEITESDIVLYQRGKQPVKWPLRCLRRYGYDSEIFSFESGRRCSTGPGIYAFKCRRADQLFNLVQSNIQVCNNSGDDTVSRDLSITAHIAPSITRMTIAPSEPNYLEPTRSSSRVTVRFPHGHQNGISRLESVSSSGPMSPQGTMGSPSPPPVLPSAVAPISQPIAAQSAHYNPSAVYVNDQVLSAIAMEIELDNNNKSLRQTMQRSHTISSTSSSGFLSEPLAGTLSQEIMKPHNRPPALPTATYINIDISSEQSPLSPTHSISTGETQLPREESATKELEISRHAYMNVNTRPEASAEIVRKRSSVLPEVISPQLPAGSNEWEDPARHCYANLDRAEIEELRARCSIVDGAVSRLEKSPPVPPPLPGPLPPSPLTPQQQQPSTPPESIREVNYAVLDLDKNNLSAVSTPFAEHSSLPSPPDSPDKTQKGYATIDFNKTAALSHSVNPNVVNDNEGSRKTRHNSTINDLTAPSRHSSSISE